MKITASILNIPRQKVDELVGEGLLSRFGNSYSVNPDAIPELERRGYIERKPLEDNEETRVLIENMVSQQIDALMKHDRDISDLDAMRYIASHIIENLGRVANTFATRLSQLDGFTATEAAQAQVFLVFEDVMRNYRPLEMRPWAYMELLRTTIEKVQKEMSNAQSKEETTVQTEPQNTEDHAGTDGPNGRGTHPVS